MSKNEINTDKMVIGLLTTPLFMLGIVQLLIIPLGIFAMYKVINSPEVLFMKVVFCALICFAFIGCVLNGVENIKKGYRSWYEFRHEDDHQ